MAKKMRFPLKMADGTEVRSLEELRANFDLESVLSYYENGKLLNWLESRYLEDEAAAIQTLNRNSPDFQYQLCKIFQVEYTGEDIDLEAIARREKRLRQLRDITEEAEFIQNIDLVAFDQEELADLLDEEKEKIYLCGKMFYVPASRKGVTYIGIENPGVHISGEVPKDPAKLGITFIGVNCDNMPQAPAALAEESAVFTQDCDSAAPFTVSFDSMLARSIPFDADRAPEPCVAITRNYILYEKHAINIYTWKKTDIQGPLPKEFIIAGDELIYFQPEECRLMSHDLSRERHTTVMDLHERDFFLPPRPAHSPFGYFRKSPYDDPSYFPHLPGFFGSRKVQLLTDTYDSAAFFVSKLVPTFDATSKYILISDPDNKTSWLLDRGTGVRKDLNEYYYKILGDHFYAVTGEWGDYPRLLKYYIMVGAGKRIPLLAKTDIWPCKLRRACESYIYATTSKGIIVINVETQAVKVLATMSSIMEYENKTSTCLNYWVFSDGKAFYAVKLKTATIQKICDHVEQDNVIGVMKDCFYFWQCFGRKWHLYKVDLEKPAEGIQEVL